MKTLGFSFIFFFLFYGAPANSAPDAVILTATEIKALLGEYPARGSQAEAIDDEILLEWQTKRTKKDCDYAASQESVTIKTFFGGRDGVLTDKEIKSLPFKIEYWAMAEIGTNALLAKNLYKRPRPFLSHPDIKPCIKHPSSTAYPSGHATFAWAMGKILAAKFPEKSAAILRKAEAASMNRVIGGVHYPSDIVAGKKLGEEIARRMLESEKRLRTQSSDSQPLHQRWVRR